MWREAFGFVCLQKLCALEFGHNLAKRFAKFLLLTSRDIGKDQWKGRWVLTFWKEGVL